MRCSKCGAADIPCGQTMCAPCIESRPLGHGFGPEYFTIYTAEETAEYLAQMANKAPDK